MIIESRRLALAGALVGAMSLMATAANAGECPAGKNGVNVMQPGATMPKGVTDKELAAIDLAKEMVKLSDRRLRIRRLVIQPGGVVPWHSHADRPALIYVVSGRITEYASNCSVPIVHKAGDVSRESNGVAHWWRNHTKSPVVLLSADVVHDQNDKDKKHM